VLKQCRHTHRQLPVEGQISPISPKLTEAVMNTVYPSKQIERDTLSGLEVEMDNSVKEYKYFYETLIFVDPLFLPTDSEHRAPSIAL
jgi:hypothetical protein